ncbi:hypothetical protein HanHA300_Chr15g0572831 [Helianthus annuus]|nr:hypothetical protein HanHA300_Chr15g0572831 [Helianthus annuus]KAJ0456614.1 hypothetical protein HanIR_Chr15g0764471 [Helianthus annuus]
MIIIRTTKYLLRKHSAFGCFAGYYNVDEASYVMVDCINSSSDVRLNNNLTVEIKISVMWMLKYSFENMMLWVCVGCNFKVFPKDSYLIIKYQWMKNLEIKKLYVFTCLFYKFIHLKTSPLGKFVFSLMLMYF